MKIAHLARTPEGEAADVGAAEGSSGGGVGSTLPVYPISMQMHIGKEELEKMGHKGPMQVGHKYELSGHMHVMGSHEDGGAHVQVTHMGLMKHGKAAAAALYPSDE